MSLATQGDLAEVLRRDKVHHNLTAALLVEQAIRRGEAQLASNGALVDQPQGQERPLSQARLERSRRGWPRGPL